MSKSVSHLSTPRLLRLADRMLARTRHHLPGAQPRTVGAASIESVSRNGFYVKVNLTAPTLSGRMQVVLQADELLHEHARLLREKSDAYLREVAGEEMDRIDAALPA